MKGSGKSFVANHYLARANYEVVSNDKSGGRDKSISLLKGALQRGRSVVVDNTHVDVEARCFVVSFILSYYLFNL